MPSDQPNLELSKQVGTKLQQVGKQRLVVCSPRSLRQALIRSFKESKREHLEAGSQCFLGFQKPWAPLTL